MTSDLEQAGGIAIGWLSVLFITASALGSICALGSAWAARRFARRAAAAPPALWPDVSILKPLFRAEANLAENLETFVRQDYPGRVQLVFGVQDPADSAIPIAKSLMERYPERDIRLVVEAGAHGVNRKVSNLVNIGRASRHPMIVMADSDVAVSPDYLRRLASELNAPGVGAVTCLYRGAPAGGFWSRVAAMAADDQLLPITLLGLALKLARPCTGATIALGRETLTVIGGFEAVVNELADDYAIGRAVRGAGLLVVVSPMLVAHAFEESSLSQLVRRELRWARTIFSVDPVGYIGSGFTHALPLALIGAALGGFAPLGLSAILAALACRLFLKYRLTRDFNLPNPNYILLFVRDILSFVVYLTSFWSMRVNWRGQDFAVARDGTLRAAVERGQAQKS